MNTTNTTSVQLSLGLIGKCGFLVISRTIAFALFGFVLNIILLIAAWPEIGPAIDIGHASHTSAGAFFLLFTMLFNPPALLGLSLLLSPVVYFLLGQKHGISRALHHVFAQSRDALIHTVLGKFREFVESRRLLTQGAVSQQIPALLDKHLRKLDNLPRPLSWLVKRFIRNSNVVAIAGAVAQRPGADQMNLAQFLSTLASDVVSDVSADALRPSLAWFWILMTVNLGLFACLKYFY